jgi:hypothetical protein
LLEFPSIYVINILFVLARRRSSATLIRQLSLPPVSLRLGHARVLTPHCGVIHYAHVASLPQGKAQYKSSFHLLKCYFCKSLWQSNKKAIIYLHIPLTPSVRRVRRGYTLILNFTYNHTMHFSTKTINPICQCFLLVTFLSRKKSDTHPPHPPHPNAFSYMNSRANNIKARSGSLPF